MQIISEWKFILASGRTRYKRVLHVPAFVSKLLLRLSSRGRKRICSPFLAMQILSLFLSLRFGKLLKWDLQKRYQDHKSSILYHLVSPAKGNITYALYLLCSNGLSTIFTEASAHSTVSAAMPHLGF